MIYHYLIAIISIGSLFLIWVAADHFCRKLSSRSSENLVGEENPTCPRGTLLQGGFCQTKCNLIKEKLNQR